ncbi:MAG TPA: trypsin-like serine protease, partial [Polyangiaceae bacterium]|nr:trypsin-like serine protease [Polyangiaceae bacterium]
MVCGQLWVAGLVGLGLLACSSVGPTSPSGSEQEDVVGGQNDSTHQAVFGIVIKNQALCSGTLLAPNLVLTARHCVSDLSTGDNVIDCTQSTFLPKYAASSFVLSYAADLTGTVAQASIFEVSDVRVPGATQFCG